MTKIELPCCGWVDKDRKEPRKGAVIICLNCGSWHIYKNSKGNVRPFNASDLLDIKDNHLQAMRHVTKLIKKRGRMK